MRRSKSPEKKEIGHKPNPATMGHGHAHNELGKLEGHALRREHHRY